MALGASTARIVGVVAFYWFISISMVFVNKHLLSGVAIIPAPLFATWFQCVFTSVVVWVLGSVTGGTGEFPIQKFDLRISSEVLPLSLLFVGMIAFNNLCLKYVELSFYNVARSMTLPFNVGFSYALLGQTTSYKQIGCIAAVCVGFVVGIEGEVNFSLLGTMFGVISSLFVCFNSIWTKKTLPIVDQNMWRLTFVNNLNACFLFIPPMVLTGELDVIIAHAHILVDPMYWAGMCVAGALGLCIGIATVMQIKATSPLAHNLSGTAKAAFQTWLAWQYYGNEATSKAVAGVALVLMGSFVYSYLGYRSRAEAPKEPPKGNRDADPENPIKTK
jgi:GDP-fucose transporter C1